MLALCEFAERLTLGPSLIQGEDVERLRAHGWSDLAISDAIFVISYFNLINRVGNAVGVEDEPEWTSPG